MQPMQETTAWVVVSDKGVPLLSTLNRNEKACQEDYERGECFAWSDFVAWGYTIRRVRITEVAP